MTETQKTKSPLPRGFLRHLTTVFETETSGDISATGLSALGKELRKRRVIWKKELREALRRLPKDHPLLCPFGLFETMEAGRLEVSHTRTLRWLLDPDSTHGFGDYLLRALLRHVCACEIRSAFTDYKVESERHYQNADDNERGRTDIWIEVVWKNGRIPRKCLVVIEAKIDHVLVDGQLSRIDRAIDERARTHTFNEIHRIFLTPKGDSPEGSRENWEPMLFSDLVAIFLRTAKSLKKRDAYEFFRMYIAGVLRNILDLPTGSRDEADSSYRLLGYLRPPVTATSVEDTIMPFTSRALGFYVRHWDVMQALYEDDGSTERVLLADLSDHARHMVKEVGKRASEQAQALLEECGKILVTHFNDLKCCQVAKIKNRPSTVRRQWEIEVVLRPKWARKHARIHWEAGAILWAYKGVASLYLYLWGRGSRKQGMSQAEDDIAKILSEDRIEGRSSELGWSPGAVAFARIPIHVDKLLDVDHNKLCKAVEAAVGTIGKRDVKKLFTAI